MKVITLKPSLLTRTVIVAVAAAGLASHLARAHPYASGISGTNNAGQVSFYMNEAGASVTVTFEDSSTLAMGVLPKGPTNFSVGAHTSWSIGCFKAGNGTPFQISSDSFSNSVFANASGFAVNKSAKNGPLFGRLYAAASLTGGSPSKSQGVYALNSDQTFVAFSGTPPSPYTWVGSVNGNFKSPGRLRVAPDNSLLVADGKGSGNQNMVYGFAPDLSSSWVVLGPSPASGAGDVFGTPCVTGSTNTGNMVLYVPQAGRVTPPDPTTPGDTNCLTGPLTTPGSSFNCVMAYNIGSGPLPWTKRPDYSYTVGLDGIAQLRPECDVEADGSVIAGFGRGNLSNPNIQILRPFLFTNGITGDPVNKHRADAARSTTNWLYTSGTPLPGANPPPFNQPLASDPWNGINDGASQQVGTYAGVRVSPDGQFLASVDVFNGITLAYMNGDIPDDRTIFGIANAPANGGNSRGMDWDAADNIWVNSSAQGLLRCFSLNLTTTCISSNDWTGTNGTFVVTFPGIHASLAVINANASQNYTNNSVNPGAPIPAVVRITLNTNDLSAVGNTFVGFTLSGSAALGNQYILNTNATPNGVTILNNGVVFPGTPFPGTGSNGPNWNVDVQIIPTANPVSGPETAVNIRLPSGTNYTAVPTLASSIAIINTGPQVLQLTGPSPASLTGMNRGIQKDQARFVITRLGDTNGPGNDAVNPIVQRSYTVTNLNYYASGTTPMAVLGVDYMAGPQNFDGVDVPVNSSSASIVIASGATTINAMIGNPVAHANTNLRRTNEAVVINLTNICNNGTSPGCNTNLTSSEGLAYAVTTAAVTLTEFDNANGGEIVLWSNPLTNSLDSTNWTVVFATINANCGAYSGSPALPTVLSNYDNVSAPGSGGCGEPPVLFGQNVLNEASDSGVPVPQSATMVANGWTNALKMTINKDSSLQGESGFNVYPQIPGQVWSNYMHFEGNYALRFDMFLSVWQTAIGQGVNAGTFPREFAAFGINHRGTNANWRLDNNPRAEGTGSYPINADGEWCCIDAASGSITPADYDLFISPPWALFNPTNGVPMTQNVPYNTTTFTFQSASPSFAPFTNFPRVCFAPSEFVTNNGVRVTNFFANAGVPNDTFSQNNANPVTSPSPEQGICKTPPFVGINSLGGAPDNAWIDVSLELSQNTNLTLKVAQQPIFNSSIIGVGNPFGTANPIAPFGGTPMLGYLDPNKDISDCSAFVYYSNLRIVELSPFIPWTNQPVGFLVVTQGTSVTLNSGALFASNPLTNVWYAGTTNGAFAITGVFNRQNGTPTAALATNTFSATNGTSSLSFVANSGTNYISTWSDQAGAITNYLTILEVIAGPGNVNTNAGSTARFTLTPSGNGPVVSYQWKAFGSNLVNNTKYAGVTTATLSISNVSMADSGVYSNLVVCTNWATGISAATTAAGTLGVYSAPDIMSVGLAGGNVNMSFSDTDALDTTNSWILQTSIPVSGPYTNVPTPPAAIGGAPPSFTVTVPVNPAESNRFYRLRHNP